MKKIIMFSLVSFFSSLCADAAYNSATPTTMPPSTSTPSTETPSNNGEQNVLQDPQAPETTINNSSPNSMAYEQLSADMKAFADKLNSQNKLLFCSVFNDMQRKNAMSLSGTVSSDGTVIAPDAAVEQVAKLNNLMPSNTGTGACKVK